MGTRNIFKSIFIVTLLFILICLSVIAADGLPDETPTFSSEIDYSKLKYEIMNKNENCQEDLEELFNTENEVYYTRCKKDVYVKWENGEIDTLEEALEEGKVDIYKVQSETEIIVVEKNEN